MPDTKTPSTLPVSPPKRTRSSHQSPNDPISSLTVDHRQNLNIQTNKPHHEQNLNTHRLSPATPKQSADDQADRLRALDPHQSFIIQAPAGSGKTELLIQRYLRLLTTVDETEKILAITFTKKAAGEMRYRIHQSLMRAKDANVPDKTHEKQTWELARNVYNHAKKMQWDCEQITNKLSIMTIDACCQQFLRFTQAPYLLSAQFSLCLQPEPIYLNAIGEFIQDHCLQPASRHHQDFQSLLLNQHHDYKQVERLLLDALKCREKWLRLTLQTKHQNFIQLFAHAIKHSHYAHLEAIYHNLPSSDLKQLERIFKSINHYNQSIGLHSDLETLAQTPCDDWKIHHWQKLVNMLVTSTNTWRSLLRQKQGFANQTQLKALSLDDRQIYQEAKSQLLTLVSEWKNNPIVCDLLLECQLLPKVSDPTEEWACIEPLLNLLPSLAAYLQLHMQDKQMIDFPGINLQLLSALLDEHQHSQLVMQIYQRFTHLLIDEFQDTSVNQFEILELAFSAWKGESHRSITVVGDPMQSIYRFRQAEVKLFRQVQLNGFAGIALDNVYLSSNYRSSSHLINQLNHCFSQFMSPKFNQFSPAVAVFNQENSGIFCHRSISKESHNQYLCKLIKKLIHNHPNQSKCLLVRSRSQLSTLLPLFRQQGIAYSGVGIDSLAKCQSVLDCFNLISLPLDYLDRKSWIGFLRAPAISLSIDDITIICQPKSQSIWDNLNQYSDRISLNGQRILQRILPPLSSYLKQFGRQPHDQLAKSFWHHLGFDLAITQASDYENCMTFFSLFQELASTNQPITSYSLEQLLNTFPEKTQDERDYDLQVMTIHKSKGLEFDIVLMPHLEQSSPISSQSLLDWTYIQNQSQFHLLMHTHPRYKNKSTSVHKYLRHVDKLAQLAETERLYYVAFTRAKSQLHILHTQKSSYPERSPMKNLQPILEQILDPSDIVSDHVNDQSNSTTKDIDSLTEQILAHDWEHPLYASPNNVLLNQEYDQTSASPTIADLLSEPQVSEQLWGVLVHRAIECILSNTGQVKSLDHNKLSQLAASIGLCPDQFAQDIQTLHQQLQALSCDKNFSWISNHLHKNRLVETSILYQHKSYRIDYAFYDSSTNTVWIIDFKTHKIHDFLQNGSVSHPQTTPAHYLEQLAIYKKCLSQCFPKHSVATALYYPLSRHLEIIHL